MTDKPRPSIRKRLLCVALGAAIILQGLVGFSGSGVDQAIDRDSYSHYWVTHSLIRLQPGDEITTSGCGWVPARAAGLDPGPVLSSQTVGNYPLLIGTDVAPGAVRVECPFHVWPVTEPLDGGRDWNAALGQTTPTAHPAGPYEAREGLIRLDC